MTDTSTAVYTVESFLPDYRDWEVVFTQPDGMNTRRLRVIGWLTIITAHDDTRHVVPAVLDGGQAIPARIACPAGWTMQFTGGHLPTIAVNGVFDQAAR